jgi:hypothetical protein
VPEIIKARRSGEDRRKSAAVGRPFVGERRSHAARVTAGDVPDGWRILDVGPETVKAFGAALRDAIIDASSVREGDKIIALTSGGLQTNGFSLARRVLEDSYHEPFGGITIGEALLAVGLLLLLRFSLLWVGIYLGLVVDSPEAVTAVQILVWPVLFLSNTFVAPETMPGWLGAISEWNPLSATVAATRELFGNPGWGGESWISQHSLLMAIAWPLAIFAIFFPLSVRRYRRLSR